MEKQLFTWDSLVYAESYMHEFEHCELIQPIGPYPTGTKFAYIQLDYDNGRLILYNRIDDEKPTEIFQLILTAQPLYKVIATTCPQN